MPLKPTDRPLFAAMLTTVNAVLGAGRELSPDVIDLYWRALAPFDLAAVRQALDRHVKNPDAGQFMPKPADIIRMLNGTTSDSAAMAWAKVEHAIRRVGGYEDVAFDDLVIHRCIEDMGGWMRLCSTEEKELPFRARDFQSLYRGFALRREIPHYPRVLIGRINAENARMGYPTAPPVLIGDKETAQKVLQFGGSRAGPMLTRATEALPEPLMIQ